MKNIDEARALIEQHCGRITAFASIWESSPQGNAATGAFLNTALMIETELTPLSLLDAVSRIESELGRVRQIHWGNRTIDLDILLWRKPDGGQLQYSDPRLTIPHPRMLERDFVIIPAAEIAGNWCHPQTGTTLQEASTALSSMPRYITKRRHNGDIHGQNG
jgi:2-amino-4-hydroxy-6-hydroxymethyldihydropteridine diphosphokinase